MKKLVLLILFFNFGNVFPQQHDSIYKVKEIRIDNSAELQPVTFNEQKIEKYKSLEEFDYLNAAEKDNWWTRFKKWLNAKYNQFLQWLFGDYEAGGIIALLITLMPFLLILALLALIVWLFSRLNPGGSILKQNARNEVFLSSEEELVKNEDLDVLLKTAIAEGDYRLAIRFYYLRELRKLDNLSHIEYQFQKTNREYLQEIAEPKLKNSFAEITKIYEFIWYGSFKVTENDFRLAEKGFLRMDSTLKATSRE